MRDCRFEQDFVPYIYDDLEVDRRAALERHLSTCHACREEIGSLREALGAVDRSRLAEMADRAAAGLPQLSLPEAERRSPSAARWLKAAAILILAGASFVAGQQWSRLASPPEQAASGESATPAPARPPESGAGPAAVPEHAEERLADLAAQTKGYLRRSRFVLLEFANAGAVSSDQALRNASIDLLRENRAARRIAGEIADPRLDELLAQLETILREISRLSDPNDSGTVERIRNQVNDSGLLDQLEILSAEPARVAQGRGRT